MQATATSQQKIVRISLEIATKHRIRHLNVSLTGTLQDVDPVLFLTAGVVTAVARPAAVQSAVLEIMVFFKNNRRGITANSSQAARAQTRHVLNPLNKI
jgi:hypothetical protein